MKTKKINIYIMPEIKDKLKIYCGKHRISFSTFCEKLGSNTIMIHKAIKDNFLFPILKNEWAEFNTRIKPNDSLDLTDIEKTKLYSNLIYLYFKKKLKDYYPTKTYEYMLQRFQNEIDKLTDDYWNYNNHIRNESRMLKNKDTREYLKRKLAQYEKN